MQRNYMQFEKAVLIVSMFFLLSGCSMFKPVKLDKPATYVLSGNRSNITPVKGKPTGLTLLISAPKTASAYDSARMIYVDRPYELSYFTKNRWADSPARMLTPLFLQTLQATRHFQAVVSMPYMDNADVRLDTELLSLQQDFTQKPSQVRMVLLAQLVNMKTHKVLATRQFVFAEKTAQDDPYSGVIAANQIVTKLLPQLAAFCVKATSSR
jgi:cholesterol transport system auxiliary component